jgi:hypothetical protein
VDDVLLHEMVHQWQFEVLGDPEPAYQGHGPLFRDVANRIGAVLGLSPVRDCKRRGSGKDLPSCAQWPHCVRPADHYLGAYRPRRRDRQTGEDLERIERLVARYLLRRLEQDNPDSAAAAVRQAVEAAIDRAVEKAAGGLVSVSIL